MTVAVAVALALVAAVALVVVVRRRESPDGVEGFRRQIDALSPEARRPVVDRVQELDHRNDASGENGDAGGSDVPDRR
ncbi:MAG: hypothetical protein M3487_10905 [Actinomycetota bacterium]|nr:hypothetical protein [Actinomycetota bacterium]